MKKKSSFVYEGPRPNRYEGWSDEEIKEDLKRVFEENAKLTEWPKP